MDKLMDWAGPIISIGLVLLCILTMKACISIESSKEALKACVGVYNKNTVEECHKMYDAIK